MVDIRAVNPRPASFEAVVDVDPDNDEDVFKGLTAAIGAAAKAAADQLNTLGIRDETFFTVSSIEVGVKPNPGPTAYKVVIKPGG
jgi:hypothetical protein